MLTIQKTQMAFSLVELGLVLSVMVTITALTLPVIMKADTDAQNQNKASRVHQIKALVGQAYTSTAMKGESTDDSLFNLLNNADYIKRSNTGAISVDFAPIAENGTTNTATTGTSYASGTAKVYPKFGGVLLSFNETFTGVAATCGTNDNIALRAVYDSDGELSGVNDSVHLYLYDDGEVRSLENARVNTCTATNSDVDPIANADPDFNS